MQTPRTDQDGLAQVREAGLLWSPAKRGRPRTAGWLPVVRRNEKGQHSSSNAMENSVLDFFIYTNKGNPMSTEPTNTITG